MNDTIESFSLVLETVNLELADIALLRQCLDSIAAQDLDITTAREILMVEGGEVPAELLEELQTDYPWLSVHRVSSDTGYEEAKMMGANLTTGNIVVFDDADCVYEPMWLSGLLVNGFLFHQEVGLLGGETMIRTDSIWGMISALLFSFNFYSQREDIYEHERFHWNNVAIRREVLEKYPIPFRQPLFRSSTFLYSAQLRDNGIVVARQPRSRAKHAAPNGWSHFFWRYLMFGHDAATVLRLVKDQNRESPQRSSPANNGPLYKLPRLIGDRLITIAERIRYLVCEDASNWLRLPVVLPIVGVGLVLMLIGYISVLISPKLLPFVIPDQIKRGSSFAKRDVA